MNKTALIVFLKAPQKGRVKTRLSRDLGEDFVLELYKGFVCDLLEAIQPVRNILLYVWPPEGKNNLETLIGQGYDLSPQKGKNLGEKMANAFDEVFQKGYEQVLLIGSDIPDITCDLIFKAFDILKNKHAVIGPSGDGGYYLVGFQEAGFSKHAFDGIDWSTPHAFDQTIRAMENHSILLGKLPVLEDIDTVEDLKALAKKVKKGHQTGKRTRKLLNEL